MRCCAAEYTRVVRVNAKRTGGVTLIETLLASALGALLLVALLGLYQRALSHHAFAESRMEVAERLFTAERILSDELQFVGNLPCGQGGARFNLVHTHQTTPWLRLFEAPVQISPARRGDELMVLKTGLPVALVDHDLARAQFTLTHAANFERGNLVVVCDNDFTLLLQVTNDAGRTLGYGPDTRVRPGNCAAAFTAAGCGPENHRFMQGALVAPYEPVVFFISDTGATPSLSRKRLVNTNTTHGVHARLFTESLIQDLVWLRVQAGIANSATPLARVLMTRRPPAHFGNRRPISLDVGLIATAQQNKLKPLPDRSLHLLGEPVGTLPDVSQRWLDTHEFSIAL